MFKTIKTKLNTRFRTQKIKSKSKSLSPRTKSDATRKLAKLTRLKASFSNKITNAPMCSICLSKILVNNTIAILASCGHTFHRACINKYKESGGKTCPLCRAKFKPEDIITPKEYKKLIDQIHNQPHTLNKTLKIFSETVTNCKQAYEDLNSTIRAYDEARTNFHNHINPPHWMLPTRYLWNKEDNRLNYILRNSETKLKEKWIKYKLKCKQTAPLTAQSRRRFNPNSYHEFNEIIQSKYEEENPGTLRMVTHNRRGSPIIFNTN